MKGIQINRLIVRMKCKILKKFKFIVVLTRKLEKKLYILKFSFEIVQKAWVANPEHRPTFADLLPYLEALRGRPEYQVFKFLNILTILKLESSWVSKAL